MEITEAIGKKQQGLALARGKWAKFTESVKDDNKAATLGFLLENQQNWMESLDEDTKVQAIGSFDKYVFPLIQIVYPNLISADLVSVQPMQGPTSLIFYRDTRFGSSKGAVNAGDSMFSSRTGWNDAAGFHYSDEVVAGEVWATADGTAGTGTLTWTLSLSYSPLRPGSVSFAYEDSSAAAATITDDGAGGLISTKAGDLAGTNTVNYANGQVTVTFDTGRAPTAGPIVATYEYNSEGSTQVPQVDIVLTSTPVQSRPRKLRARWSLESAAMLKAVHGKDAEVDILNDMANELKIEVDREIINDLLNLASANNTSGVIPQEVFKKAPPTNVSLYMHRQSFVYSMTSLSNKIFKATRRHGANWMVCGVNVANIIQGQEGIAFTPSGNYSGSGAQFIGTLNGMWKIYIDPYLDADTGIMGYQGDSMLDTGFVYAPWIPFYSTPTYVLDDFIGRKGLLTHYGKKPVNGLFYGKLVLVAGP